MKTYAVIVTKTVVLVHRIDVEAESPRQAIAQAKELAADLGESNANMRTKVRAKAYEQMERA